MRKDEMMASVDKQTIFEMPMGKVNEIILLLDGSWHHTITRVWGRHKEVDRHLFKVKDYTTEKGYRWFECGSKMGVEIITLINEHVGNKSELHLILNPLRVKYQRPEKEFLSMWERFKRFVKSL